MLNRDLCLAVCASWGVKRGRLQGGFGEKGGNSGPIFTPGKRGIGLGLEKGRQVPAGVDRSMTSNKDGVGDQREEIRRNPAEA